MFHNPDALRSESYSLSKMAIERGLVGDSISGVAQSRPPLLDAGSVDAEQEEHR